MKDSVLKFSLWKCLPLLAGLSLTGSTCLARITAAQQFLMIANQQVASSPPVLISSNAVASTNSSSSTATITSTGAGHLLVVGVSFWAGSNCVTGITDNGSSGGNTYSAIANTTTNNSSAGNISLWYATNSKSGATTLTIQNTCGVAGTVFFMEFSNLSALDGTAASNSLTSNSTTVTAPTVTTTTAHSVVVSMGVVTNNITGLHTGSAFTALPITGGDDAAYQITTSAGTYGAVFDQSPTGWNVTATAAFK